MHLTNTEVEFLAHQLQLRLLIETFQGQSPQPAYQFQLTFCPGVWAITLHTNALYLKESHKSPPFYEML